MRNLITRCFGLAAIALPSVAMAVAINYGDKNAANLVYQQVTEDSITDTPPLFGNPTVIGNALIFSPVNFGATSTGGGMDFVDGTLATTLVAKPGNSITNIVFNEAGDYTLIGTGTAATTAVVTANLFVRIVEVNNAPLAMPIQQNFSLSFSPSGGSYDLVNDPGNGITWTGNINVNVNAILAAQSPAITGAATKVLISLDNSLTATSQSGSISFIKKKTGDGVVILVFPEPATLGLVGGAAVTMLRRRR